MKSRSAALFVIASLLLVLFTVSVASGQQIGADTVARRGSNTRVEWLPQFAYASATLTVSGPDGVVHQYEFPATATPYFQTFASDGKLRSNGSYTYELNITPALSEENKAALAAAPDEQSREALVAELTQAGLLPDSSQMIITGYLYIQDGKFLTDSLEETQPNTSAGAYSTNDIAAPSAIDDQVFPDDVIVQGSLCVGFDCVNNENFGFDTLRLKENNLRIKFEDTSSGSFPSNDWQITANDSANGGANKFSIDDITNARTPFTIEASAPSHSLYVDDGGRIGFGTSTPVVELHTVDGDTPTLRLQQDGSSGFAAQTWDVAGNEANFFVRDVTNGSRLPFRIRPGAPTSSIDIAANGNVGIGTASPTSPLHVNGNFVTEGNAGIGTSSPAYRLDVNGSMRMRYQTTGFLIQPALDINTHSIVASPMQNRTIRFNAATISPEGGWEFYDSTGVKTLMYIKQSGNVGIGTTSPTERLHVAGNIVADGTITGLSSRTMKENLVETNGDVLDRVMDLSIYYYNYKSDDDSVQHVGPVSEDFAELFEVGADNKHISPMDMAGVALAAIQELYESFEMKNFEMRSMQSELKAQQDRIDDLEAQNADLEERLAALEALVLAQMAGDKGD